MLFLKLFQNTILLTDNVIYQNNYNGKRGEKT